MEYQGIHLELVSEVDGLEVCGCSECYFIDFPYEACPDIRECSRKSSIWKEVPYEPQEIRQE